MATSIRELLVAELCALKNRVEASAKTAEAAIIASQSGQRIAHLIERIEALADPAAPAADPVADAAPAADPAASARGKKAAG